MSIDLTNPMFHDADAARAHLEAQRWPNGPECPHCGEHDAEKITKLEGKAHRGGLYQCNSCRDQFSVTVGTVFERSKIPLPKWVLAVHLISASKKGVSAMQIQRMLGVTYKTAWFMMHRIREAMGTTNEGGPIGGKGKIVESDETYVGGKAYTTHKSKPVPKKHAVIALVERDGEVRAKHVSTVSIKTLRSVITKHASRKSTLMTDDSPVSKHVRGEFAAHGVVVHSKGEYVKADGFTHTQTVESFFSLLKRGVFGSFHSVSEQHLQRYVDEFAFRWNYRNTDDADRAAAIIKAAEGKRLTYRRSDQA